MTLPDGRETVVPLLPLQLAGERLGLRLNPPVLGEHTDVLLHELGYTADEVTAMRVNGIVL